MSGTLKTLRKKKSATSGSSMDKLKNLKSPKSAGWKTQKSAISKLTKTDMKRSIGVTTSDTELINQEEQTAKAETKSKTVKHKKAADWTKYMTPAREQGQCNACVSFATVGLIEGQLAIDSKRRKKAALSEASMHYCRPGGTCAKGWALTKGLKWAKSSGIANRSCFPWSENGQCDNGACLKKGATRISGYTAHRTNSQRRAALDKGPVLAGLYIYDDFFSYGGGVYRKTNKAKIVGFHAIVIIGYNEKEGYWIIKNSFGADWGKNGFGKIAYGQKSLRLDDAFPFYSINKVIT